MESFEHVQSRPEMKKEKDRSPSPEMKKDDKPAVDKAGILGEVQNALPNISGNLNNCTFNFNF